MIETASEARHEHARAAVARIARPGTAAPGNRSALGSARDRIDPADARRFTNLQAQQADGQPAWIEWKGNALRVRLRAGTPASGCRAGMGGGAESIDAKLVEVPADECEAGDSREPLGAAPDRPCGCTQVHKFTSSKSWLTAGMD